jgi:hypothetical protein
MSRTARGVLVVISNVDPNRTCFLASAFDVFGRTGGLHEPKV